MDISREDGRSRPARIAASLVGAGLLAATAAIHLDLYVTGYRTVPTIGWMFLAQVVAGLVLAAAVALTRLPAVAAAGALFALSTLGGYLLAVWVGLFGFKEVRTTAGIAAGAVEVAAFAVLATAALGGLAPAARRGIAAASAVAGGSIAAAALLAAAVASAGSGLPAGGSDGGTGSTQVETRQIGGVIVLTNHKGFTLYWFARDSSTASRCYGACAAYWPPLLGTPVAAAGVVGRLGTVHRTGGGLQATFDGHPLYTYVGDSAPGQAHGNGLDLNGGYWHEVTVRGAA